MTYIFQNLEANFEGPNVYSFKTISMLNKTMNAMSVFESRLNAMHTAFTMMTKSKK